MKTPQSFESVSDMLEGLGFTCGSTTFTKGGVEIPFDEIIGHSPVSFFEKMKRREWIGEDGNPLLETYIIF